MEMKDRLVAIRQHLRLSQKAIAKRLGVDVTSWQRYESGKIEPRAEPLQKLIEMGFNANWILSGAGEMLLQANKEPAGDDAQWLENEVMRMGYVYVPRFNVEAAAGSGAVVEDELPSRNIAFQRSWLHREFGANPADLVALQARGDSMLGRIHDGDILLIDTSEPKLRSGRQVYAFTHEGLLYVKYIEAKLDGGLIVSSDNGDVYPPQQISREDAQSVKIIGRVLWNAGKV